MLLKKEKKEWKKQSVLQLTALLLAVSFAIFLGACNPDEGGGGGGVNLKALDAAITKAETETKSTTVSADGKDVSTAAKWVTQAEMTALETAIATAKQARGEKKSQAAVDAAETALKAATATFEAAKKAGLQTSGFNATQVAALIAQANAKKADVTVSSTDGTDVAPTATWVTQAAMTALENAITALQNASGQAAIDTAYNALAAAIEAFTPQPGTATINTSALTAKIGEANTAKANVVVDTVSTNVPPGTYWVTQTVMTAFESAITAAQTVLSAATTQAAVDTAVTTLNTAITTFNTAKTEGTMPSTNFGSTLTWGTEFTPLTLGLTPGSNTTEIGVNWYSTGTAAGKVAKVRFIEGTKAAGYGLKEATGTVATASTGNVSHKATVTGLKPNTSYQYSVCTDDTNWSPMYDFKTPPATGAFKFAVIADPQLHATTWDALNRYDPQGGKNTSAGWLETMAKIAAKGVSFIASGGDQVDTGGGSEPEYTSFFAPPGLRTLPFAPVSGNHDAHLHFTYHYNVPNQQNFGALAPDNMGNYFYLYNNILFVVLNTAPYPTSTDTAAPYITRYRQTLTAATTAHTAGTYDWLIVQHHKSTASVADHCADRDIQYYVEAGFETLMSEFKVDFVLAGHDHVYARSYPLKGRANGLVSVPDKTHNAASGSTWTGVQDPIYLTFTTGSGLKYYAVAADKTSVYNDTLYVRPGVSGGANAVYPYLGDTDANGTSSSHAGSVDYMTGLYLPVSNAAYVQPYIPSYCIVEVSNSTTGAKTITFSTYAIATVSGQVAGATAPYDFNAEIPYDSITVTK